MLIPQPNNIEILSLRELSDLNLRGLQHATLSSCRAAEQCPLPGRWVISLPETLWRAGTQSIMGCLWQVSDPLAVSFMKQFYHYLKKFPRDEALRQTQLDCLNHCLSSSNKQVNSIDTANLIYWSGFSLYGNYRTLEHQSTQQFSFWKKWESQHYNDG